MLSALQEYEQFLVRQQLRVETTFDDLVDIKQAVRDAGSLLVDVIEAEQDAMLGWYHGVTPRNMTQALANLLSRVVMDLSGFVHEFESHYPEFNAVFDRERRYHAALIRAKEMDELHGNN